MYDQSLFTKEKLAEVFNHSADIQIKSVPVRHTPKGELIIIYCRPIVNIKLVHSLVIPFLWKRIMTMKNFITTYKVITV